MRRLISNVGQIQVAQIGEGLIQPDACVAEVAWCLRSGQLGRHGPGQFPANQSVTQDRRNFPWLALQRLKLQLFGPQAIEGAIRSCTKCFAN